MDRKLIDYLPHILREYREFKGITDGQQWLFEQLWAAAEKALDDQFVDTATENGIARWEKILNITPKGSDTLEARRFRIKTRLNEQLPFTMTTLRQQLSTLCGEDGYTVDLAVGTYLLIVRIALASKSNFNDVADMLQRVVPANIVINLDLKYNTHEILSGFTHEQLAAYTHEQLRSEVLANA